MFNSQSQEVLTKYFLLLIQNQRLHKVMQSTQQNNKNSYKNDSYVNDRISHIESTMGLQLKNKQQKIHQLNSYIKQLHGSNEQILKQYERLCIQYKQCKKQTERLKQNRSQAPNINIFTKTFEQQHYHIQLIQKQKVQLQEQVNRLTNVTIKQLQADIEMLNKQNQSYILSINNYRSEQNKYKIERSKLQQEINKLKQILKNKQIQQISNQKVLSQKYDKQIKQMDKKYKKQIQKIVRNYSQQTKYVKQQNLQLQHKYNQLLQTSNRNIQDLQRKSKKLKQYDEQYDIYLNKMNDFSIQTEKLKQQNVKLKQQCMKIKQECDNSIKNDKQKYGANLNKLMIDTKKQKQRIITQFNNKIQQIEQIRLKQKTQGNNTLKKQIKIIMQQKQNIRNQYEEKLTNLTTEKQNIAKQWQQLIKQMDAQKHIMKQLQRQLQSYRKSNTLHTISQKQNQTNNNANNQANNQTNTKLQFGDLFSQKQYNVKQFISQNANIVQTQRQKQNRKQTNLQQAFSPFNKIYRYYTSQSQKQYEQVKRENDIQQKIIPQINKNISKAKQNICCQQCKQSQRSKNKVNINYLSQPSTERMIQTQKESLFDKPEIQVRNNLERYRSNSLKDLKRPQQSQTNFSTRTNTLMQGSFGPVNSIQTYSYQASLEQTQRQHKINENSYRRTNEASKKYEYIRNSSSQKLNHNYQNILPQQKPKYFYNDLIQIRNTQSRDITKQINSSQQLQLLSNKNRDRNMGRTYYSTEKQSHRNQKLIQKRQVHGEQKLIRSSSLNKINYDAHLNQIQKYLSFDIIKMKEQKQKIMMKSASDRKLPINPPPQYERLKTHGFEENEKEQRNFLMQKINKIQSYRGSQNQTKVANYYKRPINQVPNRMLSMGPKMVDRNIKNDKENLNEIIYRKCQYISQR